MPFAAPSAPQPFRIAATGRYLPPRIVSSVEVDQLTGMPAGWTQKHTGVEQRHYVDLETAASMGATAIRNAWEASPWQGSIQQPDLLIGASGTPQQPIPCTAALIAAELGWQGIPCYDVNATCLSFIAALQVASGLLTAGFARRIVIVCSEIASKGLNWKEPESAGLMGDGAAAVLIDAQPEETTHSTFLGAALETWPQGAHYTEIRGGGSLLPAKDHLSGVNTSDYLFHMDGPAVFRLAAETMPDFVNRLMGEGRQRWQDIDWVVPHQASLPAVRHLRRRLGIPASKVVETIQQQGNVIAASLPLALHHLLEQGLLQRGQKVLFLGTSAGFSLGAALIRF